MFARETRNYRNPLVSLSVFLFFVFDAALYLHRCTAITKYYYFFHVSQIMIFQGCAVQNESRQKTLDASSSPERTKAKLPIAVTYQTIRHQTRYRESMSQYWDTHTANSQSVGSRNTTPHTQQNTVENIFSDKFKCLHKNQNINLT